MDHQNAWKHIHRIMGELQHYLYQVGMMDLNKQAGTGVGTGRKGGKQNNSKGCKKKGNGNPPLY